MGSCQKRIISIVEGQQSCGIAMGLTHIISILYIYYGKCMVCCQIRSNPLVKSYINYMLNENCETYGFDMESDIPYKMHI